MKNPSAIALCLVLEIWTFTKLRKNEWLKLVYMNGIWFLLDSHHYKLVRINWQKDPLINFAKLTKLDIENLPILEMLSFLQEISKNGMSSNSEANLHPSSEVMAFLCFRSDLFATKMAGRCFPWISNNNFLIFLI